MRFSIAMIMTLGSFTSVACDKATSGADGSDAGCPAVVGATDNSICSANDMAGGFAASQAFAACCQMQGGVMGGGCTSSDCNFHFNARCYPAPPTPPVGSFSCEVLNCTDDQVCITPNWQGDLCLYHDCVTAGAPCASTPTCDCINANHLFLGGTCESDDGGHARVLMGSH